MNKKSTSLILFYLALGLITYSEADYSFKIIVKYPFASAKYDSIGNIIGADSLVRFRPVKPIIFRTESESLYQESKTDSLGCASFLFEKWSDDTLITPENILRMSIDFPHTEQVIRIGDSIIFQHLRYFDIDFQRNPDEIEIILPMTVYRQTFTIGDPNWLNTFNFAIMNDMHIGENFDDFGTSGWEDDTISGQTNAVIQNNENVVAAINNTTPDFVAVLGDVTDSGERSEFKYVRKILGNLQQKPYVAIVGNHDVWPYSIGSEANVPDDCFVGEYFYDGFKTMFDSVALNFANWSKPTEFSSSPDNYSYYLNSSFNYQNYKCINVDFNCRSSWAVQGVWPEADIQIWSLDWIDDQEDLATDNLRKLLVLGHHPLLNSAPRCFNADEIHHISDQGLKNNRPIAYWIGGHIHGECTFHPNRIDTTFYNSDTVAFVITLTDLPAKEGHYSYVRVFDKAKATIVHTPPSLPLPVTIRFTADYEWIENAYAPLNYHWDFGDGNTTTTIFPTYTHVYHLPGGPDTVYKVILTVTTSSGRKVSVAKILRVADSPYNLYAEYVKEDSVKLCWAFDHYDRVLYYIIKRNGQTIATVPSSGWIYTIYIDASVQRGQLYNYEVSVKYKPGLGYPDSPPAKLTVQTPWLDAPTLSISEFSWTHVKLSWIDNSIYTHDFQIARWDDITNQWNYSYKTNWTDTLFTDNIEFPHKYKYKVMAWDNGHSSNWSNEVELTAGAVALLDNDSLNYCNNGAKSAIFGDTIHLIYYNYQENYIVYRRSIDGGNSFPNCLKNTNPFYPLTDRNFTI